MKSLNKFLFISAMAVSAAGLASCNTETTITDLPVDATSAAVYNYGTNAVLFKIPIPVKDVQWSDNVSTNDFEFNKITELSGKTFSSLTRKSDTEVVGTFTGEVANLTETKHISVNIKTSAFKGKTKVTKAHADMDLMKAFVKCYGQTSQELETGEINYYAEFEIYGATVFQFAEQTATISSTELDQAFQTGAKGIYYTKYKTWGPQYFDLSITNAKFKDGLSDPFTFVLDKSTIQPIAPSLKDIKLPLEFTAKGISSLELTGSDFYFEKA